jgi:metal-responsive CopG/Arc/MetJ family transcriptional regulator
MSDSCVSAVRLPSEISAAVDDRASKQSDKIGRSEAIRRLVEIGLKAKKT